MALPIRYNIRNLRPRWKVTLLAIFGIALVVAAVVIILSMARGFQIGAALHRFRQQRHRDPARLDVGADLVDRHRQRQPDHGRSADGARRRRQAAGVVRSRRHHQRPKKDDNHPTNITFRGVTPMAFNVRNNIKMVEGRMFTPGLFEVIVGKKIADRVNGLDIGDTINIQRKNWKVVGLFTADDSSFESEIWGDYDAMAPAIGRNGGCESLTVRLTNPAVLAAFDKDMRANPQIQVQADSERKYYENLAGSTATALIILAAFVAIVMGIGAVFGAMNTMYAIVSQRTREIGTLRALGFSRFSILFSFVMESVLLAIRRRRAGLPDRACR